MTGKADKFWALRESTKLRDERRAERQTHSKTFRRSLEILASLPAPEPLTDQEAEEMVRLLIRYQADEIGEQRRDELLAWLDKLTVKRRILEES